MGRRARSKPITSEAGYHGLMRDLRKKGCPVCRGANRAAWRYIDAILWESVNDPAIRARLRASHGFCREHALMAISVAKERDLASGLAILYEDFLRHVTADARRAAGSVGKQSRSRSDELAARHRCAACESADAAAGNYLHVLAIAPDGSAVAKAAAASGRRLCLRHLHRGLEVAAFTEEADRLVGIFARGNGELGENLREFVRKHDYRFQAEGMTPAESSSWTVAVYELVGEPSPVRAPSELADEREAD